jgi:hypothetical protein
MQAQGELWGVVIPDELYTLDALKRRLGIRDATLRAARRAGLQVYYKHGRGFVYGRDWIKYVCTPLPNEIGAAFAAIRGGEVQCK